MLHDEGINEGLLMINSAGMSKLNKDVINTVGYNEYKQDETCSWNILLDLQ